MSRDVIFRITSGVDRNQPWFPDFLAFAGQLACWFQNQEISPDDEKPDISSLRLIFQNISQNTERPVEQKLFEETPWLQIPQETSRNLLESMHEAWQRGLLQFQEIPDALAECLTQSQPEGRPWFIPKEIAELMLDLLEIPEGASLYCPFDTSLPLLFTNPSAKHRATEITAHSPLSLVYLLLHKQEITAGICNPLKQPSFIEPGGLQKFDYSAACPAAKARYQLDDLNDLYGRYPEQPLYGDVIHIRHLLSQTLKRCAVIVSSAMLQRTKGKEKLFKHWLLEKHFIRAVIKLPSSAVPGYKNTAFLLVMDKQEHTDSVAFIDASSDYFHRPGKYGLQVLKNHDAIIEDLSGNNESVRRCRVPIHVIIANDCNLDTGRYLTNDAKAPRNPTNQPQRRHFSLENISTLIRAQAVGQSSHSSEHMLEVSPADIGNSGEIRQPEKALQVSPEHHGRAQSQKLMPGDILLVIKGNTGRVGLVPAICGDNWVAGQAFQIIRLKPEAPLKDSRILFQYLNSAAGKQYLSSIRSGTGVAFLQTRDIRKMPIPMLTSEEQDLALQSWHEISKIHAEIAFLKEKIATTSQQVWAEEQGS